MKKPGEFRIGKTARDHANGAEQRRLSNRAQRDLWHNRFKRGNPRMEFPAFTCNGKKNRRNVGKQVK